MNLFVLPRLTAVAADAMKYLGYIGILLLLAVLVFCLVYLSTTLKKTRKKEKTLRKKLSYEQKSKILSSAYQKQSTNTDAAKKIEEYRKSLMLSESISDCKKLPASELDGKQNYIFISYSHKDYKKVYSDIANLKYSGVRVWYDEGLSAGQVWRDEVRQRLSDPCCSGVIFYLSENLFTSNSILHEIQLVADNKPYFAVNLTNSQPSEILKGCISNINSGDDVMDWLYCLSGAFRDSVTYLSHSAADHDKTLLHQTKKQFNVTTTYTK